MHDHDARSAKFADRPARSLPEVCRLSVADAAEFFSELELDATRQTIAAEVLKEIRGRLGFLLNVGLDYLTLDRTAPTLSGGESQRIRLAGQIGCGLVGVLYILDEPSIGLHPRDNDRLLAHARAAARHGQHGRRRRARRRHDAGRRPHRRLRPRPGVRGGEVVAQRVAAATSPRRRAASPASILSGEQQIDDPARRAASRTSKRLEGRRRARTTTSRTSTSRSRSACSSASPASRGSGKSSLVNDILVEALHRDLNERRRRRPARTTGSKGSSTSTR